MSQGKNPFSRRDLLRTASLAAVSLGLGSANAQNEPKAPPETPIRSGRPIKFKLVKLAPVPPGRQQQKPNADQERAHEQNKQPFPVPITPIRPIRSKGRPTIVKEQ